MGSGAIAPQLQRGSVLGFQAGFERLNPVYVLRFVLAEFERGFGATPFNPHEQDRLDREWIFAGMAHGLQVTADLIAGTDLWENSPSPLRWPDSGSTGYRAGAVRRHGLRRSIGSACAATEAAHGQEHPDARHVP